MLVYLLRASARPALALLLGGSTALVGLFTVLTAGSGEKLLARLPQEDQQKAGLQRHVDLGGQLRLIVIAFTAATLLYLALDWRRRSGAPDAGGTLRIVAGGSGGLAGLVLTLGLLSLALGAAATVWDVRTGHTGAKSAWGDVGAAPAAGTAEAGAATPAP